MKIMLTFAAFPTPKMLLILSPHSFSCSKALATLYNEVWSWSCGMKEFRFVDIILMHIIVTRRTSKMRTEISVPIHMQKKSYGVTIHTAA
jgi:hypothetical protein